MVGRYRDGRLTGRVTSTAPKIQEQGDVLTVHRPERLGSISDRFPHGGHIGMRICMAPRPPDRTVGTVSYSILGVGILSAQTCWWARTRPSAASSPSASQLGRRLGSALAMASAMLSSAILSVRGWVRVSAPETGVAMERVMAQTCRRSRIRRSRLPFRRRRGAALEGVATPRRFESRR